MKTLLLLLLAIALYGSDTVVVVTELWPPFRIESGDTISGIDIDLLNEIGKRMDVHFQYKRYPWARCLLMMEHGEADLLTGAAYTEERAGYMLYSDTSYFSSYPAFFSRRDASFSINTYEDLQGKVIGYTRASSYFPRFDEDTTLLKKDLSTEHQVLKMLVFGRVDLIIGTDVQVIYDLKKRDLLDTIQKEPYVPESGIKLYYTHSKKSNRTNFWSRFNDVLKEVILSEEYQIILARYLE